jgi:hypothetical protein
MKKSILLLALLLVAASTYGQADTNVKTEKKGDLTEATYFYADGWRGNCISIARTQ